MISLPNLLTCQGRSISPEGRNAVELLNRGQIAYHFKKQKFASSLQELAVTLPTSEYYNFVVETTPTIAYALSVLKNYQTYQVKSYSGAIFFNEKTNSYQKIICQTNEGVEKPTKPIFKKGILTCPQNMTEIK